MPFVPVKESADPRQSDDFRIRRRPRSHGPLRGRVLAEAEMRAVLVKVGDVSAGEPNGMPLVEYDHVIEEFAAACSDLPLRRGILPRTSIGGPARFRTHRPNTPCHGLAEDRITVEDQILRHGFVRECLA